MHNKTMYKCPCCGAIDKYKWDGDPEDDSCRCTECGTWFNACDCEIKEEKCQI